MMATNWVLRLTLLCLMISLYFTGRGQGQIKEIKIGSQVPDIETTVLENGEARQVHLSELYKGRFLILDFWATWCSPCVKGLKDYDSLSANLKNELTIIPVAYEPLEKVKPFMKALYHGLSYPKNITGDSTLIQLFPHRQLPHEVWIDSSGIVKAITDGESVNPANIASFIRSKDFKFAEKQDKMNFSFDKVYNTPDGMNIAYKSQLSAYDPSIGGGSAFFPLGITSDIKRQRVFLVNLDALQLYYGAFSKGPNLNGIGMQRVELHVKDSSKLIWPAHIEDPRYKSKYSSIMEWKTQNAYNYELILPEPVSPGELSKEMFRDLNKALPYRGSIRKRKQLAWVITLKDPSKLGRSSTVPAMKFEHYTDLVLFQHKDFSIFVDLLAKINDIAPVIDETHIDYPVDLNIHLKLVTFEAPSGLTFEKIKSELNKNGLELTKAERMVEVLYIEDK